MAVVGTLDVSGAGIRRLSSIEDKIWNGEGTSVSATMGRTLGPGRGIPQQTRTSGGCLARRRDAYFGASRKGADLWLSSSICGKRNETSPSHPVL